MRGWVRMGVGVVALAAHRTSPCLLAGWRRLVVPDAYGTAGLRRQVPVRGGGRSQPPAAGYVVAPGAFAWFDVILVDAGSGRCDAVLRPAGVSEERAARLRSLTCLPGEVSDEFNIGTGVVVPK